MPRQLKNPPDLFPPPGFSHIAIARGSGLVFIAGQAALGPDFSLIGGDDLAAQTRATMENIKKALEAAGCGFDDVVQRTVYTLAPGEFETIAKAMEEVTGSSEHPAQTLIGVTGLVLPEMLIEIDVTAVLP